MTKSESSDANFTEEFTHLGGSAYFDSTGAPSFPRSIVDAHMQELKSQSFGNPHSSHAPSQRTSQIVTEVRRRILDFVDADEREYSVIFVPNSTAGFRLVSEAFEWHTLPKYVQSIKSNHDGFWDLLICFMRQLLVLVYQLLVVLLMGPSRLIQLRDIHTSAVGVRGVVKDSKLVQVLSCSYRELVGLVRPLNGLHLLPDRLADTMRPNDLVVYSAQSNFNGKNYDLDWVAKSRRANLYVLLDAVAYCSNSKLSLRQVPVDFAVLSFYKIFGYPTGIGALIVRRESAHVLRKSYFGGGTVASVWPDSMWHYNFRDLSRRWEDGTVNFHGIMALKHAFDVTERMYGSFENKHRICDRFRMYALEKMRALKHYNNVPACVFYHDCDESDDLKSGYGPVINFNMQSSNLSVIPCTDFEIIASQHDIFVRSGSFCNSGAQVTALEISEEMLIDRFMLKGKDCRDDMGHFDNGQPAGSIRVSFGPYNSFDEIDKMVRMMEAFFVESKSSSIGADGGALSNGIVERISVFPIKSCAAIHPSQWTVDASGFRHDRRWKVCTLDGKVMVQKHHRKMALIQPAIDLDSNVLTLSAPGVVDIQFKINDITDQKQYQLNEWFSKVLGVACVLVECDEPQNSTFANRAPFLLVNTRTFDALMEDEPGYDISSFRGNIEARMSSPFVEDNATKIVIKGITFKPSYKCKRCSMINIDQKTGESNRNMYVKLYKSELSSNGVYFGRYLALDQDAFGCTLNIGDSIAVE
eukprot:Partr_v1_DN27725_c0_g1_i1_m66986 putative Molybdenum cofactor sulfurase